MLLVLSISLGLPAQGRNVLLALVQGHYTLHTGSDAGTVKLLAINVCFVVVVILMDQAQVLSGHYLLPVLILLKPF